MRDTGQELPIEDSERWVSYKLEDLWPDWQGRAHCRGVGTGNYFVDEDESPSMGTVIKQIRRASKLCEVCPVYTECLRHALEWREEYGVWAGTSGRVRKRIFALLDAQVVSLDDVIEVFLNGQGSIFRQDSYQEKLRAVRAEGGQRGRGSGVQGSGGVPHAARRQVAF